MTRKKTGSLLTNFLGSGKTENPDNSLRYLVFNIALLAGGTLLVFYGIQVLLEGSILRAISDIFTGILCFATIIFLRTKLPLRIPGGITIGAFGLLCLLLVSSGEFNGIAALWVFTFPLIAIFVLGLQMGLVYSVMLFCGIVSFTVIPGLAVRSYSIYAASRYIGVYFLVTLLTVVYELSVIFRDRRVSQLNNELLLERDTITVMKDNLNIGLFLMNQDYVIQGAYSKTLEDILCTGEIEGNKLTVLLVSSLSAKERDTLEDYFRMILTRQFDAQMLSEINPIAEFNYIDNKSHKRKILKTGFSVVDQGLNDNYILGTMEDISAAKEMEWQLIEEAGKREEEMKSLFQVIQVDPAIFGDFIRDTEYEFEKINEILKDTNISAKDVIINIYQTIHAIKSDALILGLDNFSGKLHELENVLKKYRDDEDVSFESILHVTVELEKIMKEKDKFTLITGKIEKFRVAVGGVTSGVTRTVHRQNQYVLAETLAKACEKAAADQNKKVAFSIDELDESILENGPRRIIKEVLTQLVRNSVTHGIEPPQDRTTAGKDSQGTIRLSITRENSHIRIKLSDDGKGLDFGKIREKALNQKLLSTEKANNKNQLFKVIFFPGFSTADSTDLYAGRGIGLNLVRERIKSLQGSIKLSNEPGKGATFNLLIPVGP